jgi:hypothetical protein
MGSLSSARGCTRQPLARIAAPQLIRFDGCHHDAESLSNEQGQERDINLATSYNHPAQCKPTGFGKYFSFLFVPSLRG